MFYPIRCQLSAVKAGLDYVSTEWRYRLAGDPLLELFVYGYQERRYNLAKGRETLDG